VAQQEVIIHKLSNGMTLVMEPKEEVSSAAFVFLVPAGVAYDPENLTGTANVLAELVFRGAGDMDNRTLSERLDSLGLQRNSGIGSLHSIFAGALINDNLLQALELHADIFMSPTLAAGQFESCRALAVQALDSLEDDPRQKISLLVHEKYLPYPFGRWPAGKRKELQTLTCQEVKNHWARRYSPEGAILAVAGKVDVAQLRAKVESFFGSWQGETPPELTRGPVRNEFYHQQHDGAQVHVAAMYPSVSYDDSEYYQALAAVGVLSGGMGSRLFTEVREKRGLCYAVGAGHHVIGGYGAIQCYVGSSPEQAQEAVDVMLGELDKLAEGITQDELDRTKAGLKASLIMAGESTSARALACANDYYHLGRVRSLAEIEQAINALTVDSVVEHVRKHKVKDCTVATIGPTKLKVE